MQQDKEESRLYPRGYSSGTGPLYPEKAAEVSGKHEIGAIRSDHGEKCRNSQKIPLR